LGLFQFFAVALVGFNDILYLLQLTEGRPPGQWRHGTINIGLTSRAWVPACAFRKTATIVTMSAAMDPKQKILTVQD